jgi:hypothetical protein
MARRLSGADERRAKLRKKAQEDIENSGKSSNRKSIINVGEDVSWYKPVETNIKNNYQVNKIDIIPFIIKTENHPDVRRLDRDCKVGDPGFELDVYIHFNIGVNADTAVMCLAKTYKEKCPICEDRSRMFDLPNKDDKTIDRLRPRNRVFYNVIDKTNNDEITQIWDSSAFLFKEVLNNKLKIMKARGKGELILADWDEGRTICFTGELAKGGADFDYIKFVDFDFEERKYTYPDPASKEGQENAYALDTYITPPTYQEVWELHYGEKMGSAEDKEIPDHIAIRKEHKIEDAPSTSPVPEENNPEKDNPCPGGYKFGTDNQKHDLCSGSEIDGVICPDATFTSCEKVKLEENQESKKTRGSR